MVRALFDTNILIDYLNGISQAREELKRFDDRAISAISWIEVMVGAPEQSQTATRAFLEGFTRIEVDQAVSESAVAIRRELRLRLPDAIVLASARTQGRLLVTRDAKDFANDDPGVRVPYRL